MFYVVLLSKFTLNLPWHWCDKPKAFGIKTSTCLHRESRVSVQNLLQVTSLLRLVYQGDFNGRQGLITCYFSVIYRNKRPVLGNKYCPPFFVYKQLRMLIILFNNSKIDRA